MKDWQETTEELREVISALLFNNIEKHNISHNKSRRAVQVLKDKQVVSLNTPCDMFTFLSAVRLVTYLQYVSIVVCR